MKLIESLLLVSCLLQPLLTRPIHSSSSPTFPNADTTANHEDVYASNATVYNISKALCEGCTSWAESLEFLYYHNLVRLAHWELPLTWAPVLEAHARWWAEQRRGDCALDHSFPEGRFELGENIFWGGGGGWRPGDAVRDWASEGRDYSYSANACAPGRECRHYTQIVWRRTSSVGCARVVCDGGDVFMTCNYYPPGNVVGERPY